MPVPYRRSVSNTESTSIHASKRSRPFNGRGGNTLSDMSARLDPREYDLGELREAVRKAARKDAKANGRSSSVHGGSPDNGYRPDSDVMARVEHTDRTEKAPGFRHHSRGSRQTDSHRSRRADTRGKKPEHTADDRNRQRRPVPELRLQSGPRATDRPYLPRIPGGYEAQLEIFEWLERLVARGGVETTREALKYYESVEWISEESRTDLEGFIDGLSAVEPSGSRRLSTDDHRMSLHYVARLARLTR